MRLALPLSLLALCVSVARADDVELDIRSTVQAGSGHPSIVVTPHKDLKSLELAIKSDEGEEIVKKEAPVDSGKTITFELSDKDKVHYTGRLDARFVAGGGQRFPLDFTTSVAEPLLVKFDDAPLDPSGHGVTFFANRAEFQATLKVLDANGHPIGQKAQKIEKHDPNAPLTVMWDVTGPGDAAQVLIDTADDAGFTNHAEVVTWKLELPHAEVNFDTAKHDLKPNEEPKLTAVLPQLKDALQRYKRFPGVQFWIAGHTDTMDDRAYNKALSERRARTIATWFRAHGVTLPIAYGGFGEDDLLVKTPDETPELRNRRATYILAPNPPSADVHWTKVP